MSRDDEGYDEPDCHCVQATAKAICVRRASGEEVWIPQSVVHDDSEVYQKGDRGKLVVKSWFAEKQGWL